jgi:hypothetical protein
MQQLDQDVLFGERYRLVRMLGLGGMGSVWEAEDQILGRPVAVKVLSESLAAGERAVRRFEREARAAACLFGPHIAAVYDFGRSEGRPYIVTGEPGIVISSDSPAGDHVRRDTSVMLVVGASTPSPGKPPRSTTTKGSTLVRGRTSRPYRARPGRGHPTSLAHPARKP